MGLVQLVGSGAPRASEEFQTRLRRFDPTLLVSWNPRRGKWVIEQCVGHHGGAGHSHLCERIYVWMVQTEKGDPMPLGDHVLQKLASIDNAKRGFGPEHREAFIRSLNDEQLELDRKREAEIEDVFHHNSRFNRPQLAKAWNLIQRHDLRVNR